MEIKPELIERNPIADVRFGSLPGVPPSGRLANFDHCRDEKFGGGYVLNRG